MSRGGYRNGAGRKSKFSESTVRISVPISQRDRLEEIAQLLAGNEFLIVGTESNFNRAIADILKTISPRDRSSASRLFNKLKTALKNP